MRLVYVAGPYRAASESAVVRNIRNAEAVAVELWKAGFAVLCPHMNTALMGGICPDEVWLKGDLVMLERCDLVVLVPGWQASSGTVAEHLRARELGIPVLTWPEDFEAIKLFANADGPFRCNPTMPATISVKQAAGILGRHAAEQRKRRAAVAQDGLPAANPDEPLFSNEEAA